MSRKNIKVIYRTIIYNRRRYTLAKSFAFIHPIFSISYNDIMIAVHSLEDFKQPTCDSIDFITYFNKKTKAESETIKNVLSKVKKIANESKELITEIQESINESSSNINSISRGKSTLEQRMQHLSLLLKSYKGFISIKLEEVISQFIITNLIHGYKLFNEDKVNLIKVEVSFVSGKFKIEVNSVINLVKSVLDNYANTVISSEHSKLAEAVRIRMEHNAELKSSKKLFQVNLQNYIKDGVEYLTSIENKLTPIMENIEILKNVSSVLNLKELKDYFKVLNKTSLSSIDIHPKRSGYFLFDPSILKPQLDCIMEKYKKVKSKLELMYKDIIDKLRDEVHECKKNLNVEQNDLVSYTIILKEIQDNKSNKMKEQLELAQEISNQYMKNSNTQQLISIEKLIK